jgi:hypothetical protein
MSKNNFITTILHSMTIFGLLTFSSCDSSHNNTEQVPPKEFANPTQQDFVKKKSDLFYNSIIKPTNSAATTMFKKKTKHMTKEFLKENNNILTNWKGTVVSVMACDANGTVVGSADESKKILILIVDGGTKTFDDGEDNYALTLEQAQNTKQGTKGIYPNNAIYDKVVNLKEGQKIKFSAKVLKSDEHGIYGPVGKDYRKFDNQETGLDVEFTAVEILPTQEAEQ